MTAINASDGGAVIKPQALSSEGAPFANQIIGYQDGAYCLTPVELRALADAAEKMETLGLQGDQTLVLNVEGLEYEVTFGWDDTGNFGVLKAVMP